MSEIKIVQGDITKMPADAIVNAANRSLLGGGGVDGAIHAAAGPELLAECEKLGGCETGQAKITKGYNLPAKYVIHTVGPVYHSSVRDAEKLRACYYNSLEVARKNNLHSIIFSSISTGVYGYPADKAEKLAFDTIRTWQKEHPDYQIDITLCAYDKWMYQLMKKLQ
ncbi:MULTISPECIES: O-acetyl-ADP-ribose deacetylase [Lactobacillus]|uniref:O-acetyl-ADP-ribose deacetylase n=1 Tax=Lactobacillus xujianguonis TaxID=2495899 RepID=A0A437SU02_9LACO|nr:MULTISPECIES: O-acetyl-ADP-ribose deacetylase [Lactobacillus]RVU70431.1 O-acetyl-ADP-ribose deacetylase [Lactobacillus xujianguonis]